jgi:SAM-dependent methyltransferase
MSDVKRHYAELLGPVYTWYTSAAGDPVARAARWLERHGLVTRSSYLDLGAGSGAHALALLRAGKQVTAVDFDAALLAEIRAAAREYAEHLTLRDSDMLDFVRATKAASFDVILCAGDTLTHLPTLDDVDALVRESARCLTSGGRFAVAYRDSTRFAVEGIARFVEVARDATRTMHCLLEPIDAEHLRVTDIVTEVGADGPRTRLGDYVKLRVAPERIVATCGAVGLALAERTDERGMTTLCFDKR